MSIQDTEIPGKIECPYCSTVFDENEERCPKCGAFPSVDQKLPELSVWQYLQALLPSEIPHSQDREDNAIKQRVILIQGSQESGKSNTARVIVQGLRGHYKARDVSVEWVSGENFKDILEMKWDRKQIQVKVVEDVTDCEISEIVARDFFRIRHVMAKKTGLREGLCVLIFTLHAFYDMPISFRRDYDSLIIQRLPMGKSDLQFVEENIGPEGIKVLEEAEAEDSKGVAVVTVRRRLKAIVRFPRAARQRRLRQVRNLLHRIGLGMSSRLGIIDG